MVETEAACLLRTGALYTRRIGLKSSGDLIFAGVKRGAFSLYFGNSPIFHFDLEGRWQRAFFDGVHYRKSLDNTIDALDRVREDGAMVIKRRTLGFAEVCDLDERIRQVALELREQLGIETCGVQPPPAEVETLTRDELASLLERIATWDAGAWFAHREKYLAAYGPQPIALPPDAQNAIVLQATGKDGFFRTPREFENHVQAVLKLLGRRAIAASNIFLADGFVLARPLDDLLAYITTINKSFAFVDGKTAKRPKDRPFDAPELSGIELLCDDATRVSETLDTAAWTSLAQGRVRRVAIRVCDSVGEVARLIQDVCEAEVAVAPLVEHGSLQTSALKSAIEDVNAAPTGAGDIVYLISDGTGSEQELASIRADLKARLQPSRERGVKVIAYNPDKQWL